MVASAPDGSQAWRCRETGATGRGLLLCLSDGAIACAEQAARLHRVGACGALWLELTAGGALIGLLAASLLIAPSRLYKARRAAAPPRRRAAAGLAAAPPSGRLRARQGLPLTRRLQCGAGAVVARAASLPASNVAVVV